MKSNGISKSKSNNSSYKKGISTSLTMLRLRCCLEKVPPFTETTLELFVGVLLLLQD